MLDLKYLTVVTKKVTIYQKRESNKQMAHRQNSREEDRILRNAARGDSFALGHLVKYYSDLAYTIAIKIVVDPQDAEEVVQDSFMKAFASLHRFKRSSRFSTWLYRIVYNTALTKIKGRRNTTSYHENLSVDATVHNVQNKGWEDLVQSEKIKYIDLAMGRLSQEDRLIFTLHYTGGKTISEIGDVVGLKKSAIKMRLARGRNQLKEELKLLLGTETNELL